MLLFAGCTGSTSTARVFCDAPPDTKRDDGMGGWSLWRVEEMGEESREVEMELKSGR